MRLPIYASMALHAAAFAAAAAVGIGALALREPAPPDWTFAIAPTDTNLPAGAEPIRAQPLPLVAEVRPESWTPPSLPAPDANPLDEPKPTDPTPSIPLDEPGAGPAPVAWAPPSAPATPGGSEAPPEGASAANAAPRYPEAARRRGVEGTVSIRLHVAPDGRVIRAEVARSSGSALLDEAAREALSTWGGPPARDGRPLESAIRFALQDGRAASAEARP